MSRAKTYLRFYRPRFSKTGRNRSASELLAEIPVPPLFGNRPIPRSCRCHRTHHSRVSIQVAYAPDWAVSDRRLELYQKCPRRFFYTHVLGLGAARKATAFSRTHDCLYEVIRLAFRSASRRANPASPRRRLSSKKSGTRVGRRITALRRIIGGLPRAWLPRWSVLVPDGGSAKPNPLHRFPERARHRRTQ